MNPWPARRWTDEEITEALHAWVELTGETPAARDWAWADNTHPSTQTLVARWGSWELALEATGLTNRPKARRFDHVEAARMRKAGVPDVEIARRLGVTGAAINHALGKRPQTKVKRIRTREERIADLEKAMQYQTKGETDVSHDA